MASHRPPGTTFCWGALLRGCGIGLLLAALTVYGVWEGRPFLRQLITTALGAALAFAAAIRLYRWQEERARNTTRRQEQNEARALLVAIREEVSDDTLLLQGIDSDQWFQEKEHYKLRTVMMEWGCTRLLQLLRDYELAGDLALLTQTCVRINRLLDGHATAHYQLIGSTAVQQVLTRFRERVREDAAEYDRRVVAIEKAATRHLSALPALVTRP